MSRNASDVRVTLELTFKNVTSLWEHAARRAAADHGLHEDEIVDTFGPCEDPDLSACAAMLFDSVLREDDIFDTSAVSVTQAGVTKAEAPKPPRSTAPFWVAPVGKPISLKSYFRHA